MSNIKEVSREERMLSGGIKLWRVTWDDGVSLWYCRHEDHTAAGCTGIGDTPGEAIQDRVETIERTLANPPCPGWTPEGGCDTDIVLSGGNTDGR